MLAQWACVAALSPQVVEIVCCKLTPLQLALYCHFLESKVGGGRKGQYTWQGKGQYRAG